MKTFRVRVKTNQRKESFTVSGDLIEAAVKEKPTRGAANQRIITLIALRLGVTRRRVRILRGHSSPSKLVTIGE